MSQRFNAWMWALGLISISFNAAASVPEYLPVGGFLTDATQGQPLSGEFDMRFALYNRLDAAEPFWVEHRQGEDMVLVNDGVFAVYLGEVAALDMLALVEHPEVWLGVAVGGDREMDRIMVGAVPFAAEAKYCRAVVGETCDVGTFLQGWDADAGTPICTGIQFGQILGQPDGLLDGDNDTQYTNGTGILLEGSVFSLNKDTVEAWARGVCYYDESQLTAILNDNYVEHNETNSITNLMVADGALRPEKISGTAWTSNFQGEGTGMDADLLDGFEADEFADVSHGHDEDYQPVYRRTVVVGPVGNGSDQVANGQALRAALEGINDASESSPYLLKIEPGTYKVIDQSNNLTPLYVKPYIEIEGSGESVTKITSVGGDTGDLATVIPTGKGQIRFLTIENTGDGKNYAQAIYCSSGDVNLVHVTAIAASATEGSRAIYIEGGESIVLRHVTAKCDGSSCLAGIYARSVNVKADLRNVGSTVTNSTKDPVALRVFYGPPVTVRDSVLKVDSPTIGHARTLYLIGANIDVINTDIYANGDGLSLAVYNGRSHTRIHNSRLVAEGGSSDNAGVLNSTNNIMPGSLEILNSSVTSVGPTVEDGESITKPGDFKTRIANSRLAGDAMVTPNSDVTCASVVDENFAHYANTCP